MERYILNFIAINCVKGIGKKTLNEVEFCDLERINGPLDMLEYIQSSKFPLKRKSFANLSVEDIKVAFSEANKIVDNCSDNQIEIITKFDTNNYPTRFFRLSDYPPILYAKGNIKCLKKDGIAVISTREPSDVGKSWGTRLAELFAEQGYTVISGLALGSDSCGHQGCLNGKGLTIAVMPCSLEKVYPAQNRKLMTNILANNGCAISEYPVGSFTSKACFVERDRLQSGLAIGVAVIETGVKGGSWHAINTAKKIGIPVGFLEFNDAHYAQYENSKGNKMAIEEQKCFGLKDRNSINEFLFRCKNITMDTCNDEIQNVQEQGSLF